MTLLLAIGCALAACGGATSPPPATPAASSINPLPPTRTPAPTAPPVPTATRRPRGDFCQFPLDYDRDGALDSAGIYRFVWQSGPVALHTGAGDLTLTAPAALPPGKRDLIVLLNGAPDPTLELPPTLPPGGAVVYDPGRDSVEFRDAEGRPLLQRLSDPRNDGLFAVNQDIVSVERLFGPGEVFTMTISLRGRRGIRLETQYEAWQLHLGDRTYEYQVWRNSR
ncbi:MAG: hypothetical protein HY784_04395 [Chloroflexi bacterium]|nr:hypothetical protein [Chloroflexota bacterium]